MTKSRRLGSASRRAIIFDQDDLYRMLRAAIEREGGADRLCEAASY